jgi:GNAT superfamily N-acetyltransferase
VGFVNVISAGVLSCYIPLLEVLPPYRNQGIGKELMKRALRALSEFYMIDLSCDEDLRPFYESMGMKKTLGMMHRNYEKQSRK